MTDALKQFEAVLRYAKLGERLSSMLGSVRDISDNDEQTLARLVALAHEVQCPRCHGRTCSDCGYTGKRKT